MVGIVYLAECKTTGKKYVGITRTSLKVRWQSHVRLSKREPTSGVFCRAIAKYGAECFTLSILEECVGGLADLGAAEIRWIEKLGTKVPNGYNLTIGGYGAQGFVRSDEWKRQLSERQRGRKLSEETKKKISESHRGKRLSEKHKHKLSKLHKGRIASAITRQRIGAAHRGKRMSAAHKDKLRQIRLGKSVITESGRRSLSRPVMAEGKVFSGIHEASDSLGILVSTIDRRIVRGVAGYQSLKPKINRPKKSLPEIEKMRLRASKPVVIEGVTYSSMTEAAKSLGMTRPGIAYRIKIGRPQYTQGP